MIFINNTLKNKFINYDYVNEQEIYSLEKKNNI